MKIPILMFLGFAIGHSLGALINPEVNVEPVVILLMLGFVLVAYVTEGIMDSVFNDKRK